MTKPTMSSAHEKPTPRLQVGPENAEKAAGPATMVAVSMRAAQDGIDVMQDGRALNVLFRAG